MSEPTFYTPTHDRARLGDAPSSDYRDGQVLLLGDSISIGYTPGVCRLLQGFKKVCRPDANCGDTESGLRNIEAWLGGRRWELIHFNWGLHDLCYRHPESALYGNRDKVRGTQSVPVDRYAANLRKLVGLMSRQADRLVFATTTVVPEGEAGRFAGDEVKYNEAARAVAGEHGIVINDLYALTRTLPASSFIAPGDVHFTGEAYQVIAEKVAGSIREVFQKE